nr:65-kDa microtubule-associated protein 1-like [Tanacetum cinerariifolium]
MLLQLEQECLNVYKRKVEQAAKSKACLLQALADAKLEFSTLLASLGDKSSVSVIIWDEVGESDEERDKMLLQLEQECLNVYKRKVEQAAKSKACQVTGIRDDRGRCSESSSRRNDL